MSSWSGSVLGGDEVFILTEKVIKGNIKIRFFQENDEEERIWQELANFSEGDVHHQYAIVFKTPPYRDPTVTESVDVYYELYRPSDDNASDKKTFRFLPTEDNLLRKRKRDLSQTENGLLQKSRMLSIPTHQYTSPYSPISVQNSPAPQQTVQYAVPPRPQVSQVQLQYSIETMVPQQQYTPAHQFNPAPAHQYNSPQYTIQDNNLSIDKNFMDDLMASDGMEEDRAHFTHVTKSCEVPVTITEMTHTILVGGEVVTDSAQSGPGESNEEEEERSTGSPVSEQLSTAVKRLKLSNTDEMREAYKLLSSLDDDGNNVLHSGVVRGDLELVEHVLELADRLEIKHMVEERNSEGHTPLHLAIINRDQHALRLLVKAGASLSTKDRAGNSSLHLAIPTRSLSVLVFILNSHINASIPNNQGLFPLHMAVKAGWMEGVAGLVKGGEEVDAVELLAGRTPLHLALELGNIPVAKLLIKAGQADVSIEDYRGRTTRRMLEQT